MGLGCLPKLERPCLHGLEHLWCTPGCLEWIQVQGLDKVRCVSVQEVSWLSDFGRQSAAVGGFLENPTDLLPDPPHSNPTLGGHASQPDLFFLWSCVHVSSILQSSANSCAQHRRCNLGLPVSRNSDHNCSREIYLEDMLKP